MRFLPASHFPEYHVLSVLLKSICVFFLLWFILILACSQPAYLPVLLPKLQKLGMRGARAQGELRFPLSPGGKKGELGLSL